MGKIQALFTAVIVIFVAACAPATPPTPPTAPAGPVAVPTASAPVLTTSGDDDAWTKVVQAAKKEGRLVAYTYDMHGDVGLKVAKAFKERYGISLEPLSMGSVSMALERIRTEYRTGQQTADMVDTSIRGTSLIMGEGFSASISELPVFKEGDVWVTPPNSWDSSGRQMITHLSPATIHINKNLVRPEEEPTSWYDLLSPKWKGQIIMSHPSINSSVDVWYVMLVGRNILEKDYFERLATQEIRFASGGNRGPTEALARGEAKIALSGTTDALPFIREGAPLKALSPKEGVIGSSFGLTMLSKAPHPNATRVFINWLFSSEGATVYARARNASSIRKGIPNFTPEAARVSLDKVHTIRPEDDSIIQENWKNGLMAKILGAVKK